MAINSFPPSGDGPIQIPDQLIDPVSKFRVSNPENLIDTDFEYGLQPTKWETVELINNTPSFFSKSGDTTIDGISSIITNAGTREIIVKTELDHGLAVGIPINVTGTKSITADGAYIINSIPDTKTFTYLCKDNQTDTNSILDLYSSIITGEFFQGSQLRISDSDGIVTDAEGTSILTVTTNTTHGFGENTPFYFLNLNSTVAQEFQAANTASKSFDASNSATAQTFDGSNSLSSVSIDWSNSATFGGTVSNITATDTTADRITVSHTDENFNNLPVGTPLYHNVTAISGYFNTIPRGVVFLKSGVLGTSSSAFQVSAVPDGDPIDITTTLSGTFQIANQARTFAGNNINPLTQTVINIEVESAFNFDGGNQGYTGAVQEIPPNNTLNVLSYTGTDINADGAAVVDYYVGAMVFYTTSGTAPTGLVNNTTYFIKTFVNNSGGNYTFTVSELPTTAAISISGGTGTQTFSRIGLSLDKDIVHIPNSAFQEDDMIEYSSFPVDGRFDVSDPEEEKLFYFVDTAYDTHNYKLSEELGFRPVVATGGLLLPDVFDQGRIWRVHQFSTVGTSDFVVSDAGSDGIVEALLVGGGGGGGARGGGGGGGGVVISSAEVSAQTYPVVVGAGGARAASPGSIGQNSGSNGASTTAIGLTAPGGGGGGGFATNGLNGATGGGVGRDGVNGGIPGAGSVGSAGGYAGNWYTGTNVGCGGGGGGGGAQLDTPHRYWRFVVGATTNGHIPRMSRLGGIREDGSLQNFFVFTGDNTSDQGGIPAAGTVYPYDFTTPVRLRGVFGYSTYTGGERGAFVSLQWSDDNTTWTNAMTNTNFYSYSSGGLIFREINSVTSSYSGFPTSGSQSNGRNQAGFTTNEWGGNGGDGRLSTFTGQAVYYGGGGGGGNGCRGPVRSAEFGIGGLGGGGNGNDSSARVPTQGVDGLGGGGGGGGDGLDASGVQFQAARGGNGIAILRYPITPPPSPDSLLATGGETSEVTIGNTRYLVHKFVNIGSSIFEVTGLAAPTIVEVLIVAGGGSGGVDNGGGGGGGGVIDRTFTITETGTYPVVVGAGGASRPGVADDGPGNGGQNSTAFGFTALGGAGGTGWVNAGVPTSVNGTGINGGSGSGQSSSNGGPNPQGRGLGLQPSSSSGGFGNNGGTSVAAYAGGGGGAGGVGQNAISGRAGAGGVGYPLGGKYGPGIGTGDTVGAGGTGGWDVASGFSSNGQISNNGVPKVGNVQSGEQPAPANTGNGGHGGNHNNQNSGAGGSGIVVIRYPIGTV